MSIRKSKYADKIIKMRNDGMTFEEIGKELGITKQYVNHVYNLDVPKSQIEIYNRVKYIQIKNWMVEHDLTLSQFCECCNMKKDYLTSKVARFLMGESKGNIETIRTILEVTGLTFEEAFEVEKDQR